MRIVYINPVGVIGGAERVLLDLMAWVRATHPAWQLHLIALAKGPLLAQAENLGVQVHCLPAPTAIHQLGDSGMHGRGRFRTGLALMQRSLPAAVKLSGYVRRLRMLLRRLQPAIVHSNGLKSHVISALATDRSTPLVWHLHDFISARPLVAKILRWTARRADAAIAVSRAVARDAARLGAELPISVIHNGIDTDHFSPALSNGEWLDQMGSFPAGLPHVVPRSPDRGTVGRPCHNGCHNGVGVVRVGLVATFARWKGHDTFLQAIARLREHNGPPLRFYIIGGPIYQTVGSQFSAMELQRRAAELGITGRVGFIDFQPDPAPIYRSLDIVVHASTRPEPFGLTIVEAMACGKPVIVANAGGAAELFTDQEDAVGVTPGDPNQLARAIEQLGNDPKYRRRLELRARQTAVNRFSRDRLGQEVVALYDSISHSLQNRFRHRTR